MTNTIPPDLAVAFFQNAKIPIAWVEPSGVFRYVNPAYCELLGCMTDTMVVGTHWRIWTHPDDIKTDEEFAERVRSGEIPGYVFDKRYIPYGSTAKDKKERCGQLLVLGMWSDEDGSREFLGFQVQFLPTRQRFSLASVKAMMQWALENKATIALIVTTVLGVSSAWINGSWQDALEFLSPSAQESNGGLLDSPPEPLSVPSSDPLP